MTPLVNSVRFNMGCVCVCEVDMSFPGDPYITAEMYNVAVSLIQNFDEMETKQQRSAFTVTHTSVQNYEFRSCLFVVFIDSFIDFLTHLMTYWLNDLLTRVLS